MSSLGFYLPALKFRRSVRKDSHMPLLRPTFLLFALNLFDAILTIVWVRSGVATEGNQLMARLLDMGNLPFLGVKVAIGFVAAMVILYWRDLRVARYGLSVALAIYLGLMTVHLFTGLSAVGYIPASVVSAVSDWSAHIVTFFMTA
jgi:hypothetical protein